MAFKFRICQNDTTSALRGLFDATPVRVPEASIQPLIVVAEKDGKTEKRGDLIHLLADKSPLNLNFKEEPVSDVNLEKTRSMDWDFGFKLLDGFFKGFNLPSAAVGAKLSGAKEISLSFTNVRRRRVDKNELGSALQGRKLDLSHPSAKIFLGAAGQNMLLITDVIISNGFAINVLKTKDNGGNIEIPAIQQIINEAKLGVKVKSNSKDSIEFEGPDFLTFAFTCVKMEIDRATGDLAVGTAVITKRSASGEVEKVEVPKTVELDDDTFEPGMLEWD